MLIHTGTKSDKASLAFRSFFLSASLLILAAYSSAASPNNGWHSWRARPLQNAPEIRGIPITASQQTSSQKLFLAGPNRVFLHDGLSLSLFTRPIERAEGPPVSSIVGFFEHNGYVHLLTRDGAVRRLHDKSEKFSRTVSEHDHSFNISVRSFVKLGGDRLVLLSDRGIWIIDLSSGLKHFHGASDGETAHEYQHIFRAFDGGFGAVDSGGTFSIFNRAIGATFQRHDGSCSSDGTTIKVRAIANKSEEEIFILTTSLELKRLHITDVSCDESTIIPAQHRLSTDLKSADVFGLYYLNKSKAIAIATSRGLIIIRDKYYARISKDNSSLRSDEIISVEEIEKNQFVLGTYAGAFFLEETFGTEVRSTNDSSDLEIIDIYAGARSPTFAITRTQVYAVIEDQRGIRLHTALPRVGAGELSAIGRLGNRILVGKVDGELSSFELHPNSKALDSSNWQIVSKLSAGITAIAEVRDDYAFIATYGQGVFCTNGSYVNRPVILHNLPNADLNHIIDLQLIDSELLAMFTLRGAYIARLPKTQFNTAASCDLSIEIVKYFSDLWQIIKVGDKLLGATPSGKIFVLPHGHDYQERAEITDLSTDIYGLENANNDDFWITTSGGVYLGNTKGDLQLIHPLREEKSVSPDYGVSGYDAETNTTLFGGIGGLIVLNNSKRLASRQPPSLRVIIDNNNLGIAREFVTNTDVSRIEIEHSEFPLSFSFRISGFPVPDSVVMQTRMAGLDSIWSELTLQDTAFFRSLPPGNYTFKARGADASGVWSTNEISIPIKVLPPWYQSWPAYGFYAFCGAGLVLLAKRANEARLLREKKVELEQEIQLAQEHELDELQNFAERNHLMMQMFGRSSEQLLDCVTQIVAVSGATPAGSGNAGCDSPQSRIAALQLLQQFNCVDTTLPSINLRSYTDSLYDELVAAIHGHSSDIIFINDVEVAPASHERAPYLAIAIRELLANSLLHGHDEAAPGAIISLRLTEEGLDDSGRLLYELLVEDNGRGCGTLREEDFGPGLRLVRELAITFGGELLIEDIGGTRARATFRFDEVAH
jgi:two-component sensor histidine kinase